MIKNDVISTQRDNLSGTHISRKAHISRVTEVVESCQMCWNLHRMQHICNRYATNILICIGHFSVEILGNVLFCAFLQAVHLLVNIGWECLHSQTYIRWQI